MIAREHSWMRQYVISPRLSRYSCAAFDDVTLLERSSRAGEGDAGKAQGEDRDRLRAAREVVSGHVIVPRIKVGFVTAGARTARSAPYG